MRNLIIIFCFLLFLAILSCKQGQGVHIVTNHPKMDTIQIFAQARPGGNPFDFKMPIDRGLDGLQIFDPITTEIDSNELVIGVFLRDIPIAVPIKYLSGFEVANLIIDSNNYLLTWCPLVGTARVYEGEVNGEDTGFDFGRGLIDNNLLIVDRKTGTVWNQLSNRAVKGQLEGQHLKPLPSIQSKWHFWKEKYPNTKVAINQDTSKAVFPNLVMQDPLYRTWIPGTKFVKNEQHQVNNLGLGLDLKGASVFFPLKNLLSEDSPLNYSLNDSEIKIHSDSEGLTAWAEDKQGQILPAVMVYNWAWKNFYPNTETYNGTVHKQ